MSEAFTKAENLAGKAREYVDTKIELLKLTVAEKSSAVLADIIAGAIVAIVVVFFLVFLSIAVAIVLSGWIGNPYAGFFIVSGLYLFIGFFILKYKESLIRIPIMNNIIEQLFKNDLENDKEN